MIRRNRPPEDPIETRMDDPRAIHGVQQYSRIATDIKTLEKMLG